MIADLLFELILDLIPKKIRKVVGIILIIFGILLSLIAIPLWLMARDTDLGIISAILAIPIVLSFLFGFILISSTSKWGSRNVSLLD